MWETVIGIVAGCVSRLVAPSSVAGRVLKITGVDRCMPVYAGRDEAIDAALAARAQLLPLPADRTPNTPLIHWLGVPRQWE